MTGKRKDANHRAVVEAFESAGAVCVDCTVAPQLGFDLLVAYRSKLYVIEVKDGAKPASQRKLTEGEAARKQELEYKGVSYNIVEDVDSALRLIGAIK